MTGEGQGEPFTRAMRAGGKAAGALLLTLTAGTWSVLVAVLAAFLVLTRGFILYPLVVVIAAGVCVAGAFALAGEWSDAASALVVAGIGGAVLGFYGVVALRLDPRFFRQRGVRGRREW